MIVAIALASAVVGFMLGAVILGTCCYKDGYDKGVQAVYDYYRDRKYDL